MIPRIRGFIRENPHSLILLYYIFYLAGFVLLEKITVPRYIIYCPLDDMIPFCEWFLIPYASWFILLLGAPLYFLLTDKRDFLKITFIMFTGMTLCLLLYLLFPNGLQLRPQITGDNLLCRIAQLLYSIDTPTNVCPSIHVSSSVAAAIVVNRSQRLKKRYKIRILSTLWVVLICLSTLFVKQHSVIDLLCGTLVSLVLAAVAYSPRLENRAHLGLRSAVLHFTSKKKGGNPEI